MTDTRLFLTVLLVAALVPVLLLLVVRFAAWIFPPSYRWLAAFELRHRFAFGLLQASVWLLWAVMPSTWDIGGVAFRILFLLFAVEALVNAVRYRRGQEDLFTRFIKSRLTRT
jgi:thiol:disulfide interchange protein